MTAVIEWLIEELGRFVIAAISTFGYTGIVITMAIESACIPLPSEIIMPFSGYLVSTGQFSMLGVTLAGAVGNVLGSLVAYYVGVWGGKRITPGQRADEGKEHKLPHVHTSDPGRKRNERSNDRQETADHHRRIAVFPKPPVGQFQIML